MIPELHSAWVLLCKPDRSGYRRESEGRDRSVHTVTSFVLQRTQTTDCIWRSPRITFRDTCWFKKNTVPFWGIGTKDKILYVLVQAAPDRWKISALVLIILLCITSVLSLKKNKEDFRARNHPPRPYTLYRVVLQCLLSCVFVQKKILSKKCFDVFSTTLLFRIVFLFRFVLLLKNNKYHFYVFQWVLFINIVRATFSKSVFVQNIYSASYIKQSQLTWQKYTLFFWMIEGLIYKSQCSVIEN